MLKEMLKKLIDKFSFSKYYEFGLEKCQFNSDEKSPELEIVISHFSISNFNLKFLFKNVLAYNLLDESNVYFYDDEIWDEYCFIYQFKKSKYLNFLYSSTLLTNYIENCKYENVNHFRILTQNFYIDIISTFDPEITLIDL